MGQFRDFAHAAGLSTAVLSGVLGSGALVKPLILTSMVGAIGLSASDVVAQPYCQGKKCDEDSDCGSKCTCNEHETECLDNTENELQ